VESRPDGLVSAKPNGERNGQRTWRRSIYVQQRRTELPTLLTNFDLPQMNPNCVERSEATVAPQALHLLNNAWIRELANALAQRVHLEAGTKPVLQVERLYWIALGRPPTTEERTASLRALADLDAAWHAQQPHGERDRVGAPSGAQRALASLCHSIVNSAAFLYVD
jgi:hypothetical protein